MATGVMHVPSSCVAVGEYPTRVESVQPGSTHEPSSDVAVLKKLTASEFVHPMVVKRQPASVFAVES